MSQGKVKLYKNPARSNSVSHKPYVPQYQVLGVEPQEYKSSTIPSNTKIASSNVDNPRTKNITLRQELPSNNTRHKVNSYLPNVGVNREQTWSSVDAEIIDDLDGSSLDHEFIDNNDYITNEALGIAAEHQPQLTEVGRSADHQQKDVEDILCILQDLENDSYLLIVNGVCLCSGPLNEIQEQARALVFGEHELCEGNPIDVENLIIIKKVTIKMGLFLE